MRNTRKRPICASTRNKWIAHPVTRFYDGEHHNLSSYFLYEGKNVVAMINPVYDKKTNTLAYRLDVVDPDTGKSRTVEDQCTSSREAMDVYDERKDYFVNESTKTRKVECSMRKRAKVTAGKFKSFRTFDVVSNGKVMKGFDADTFEDVAREVASWSEHCNKGNIITVADRSGHTRDFEVVRKGAVRDVTGDTLDERQAMGASTRIRKPVSCTRRFTVKASTTAKRRKRVCASASNKEYSIALERDTADDLKAFLRKNGIKFEPSSMGMLTHIYLGHLTNDEVNLINDYLDTLGEYPIDVEDYRDSLPEVNSSKRVSASKRMRKTVRASYDPSSQYYKALRVIRDNINMEFDATIIGEEKIEVDDIQGVTNNGCSFTIWISNVNGDYDKDTTIKVVSTEEAFANDTFLILVGQYKRGSNEYMEISRFGAKKIVADKINEIAENMSDGVTASTSIKCSDPIDSQFMVDLYYSPNHRGRAGDRYFYDWSEAEEYAHEALMNGLYVSIWNKENGDTLDISPDEYNEAWENGAADFDVNEDIVEFKNRIINSAKSIKCSDNADLTVDLSNLELGEPKYELREDDPETPDQWVLVIGKNPTEQKNYKLWYYMDSTDADLTAIDLNNPDHIDLDEMSTMDDYDEIQLAQDIKCSTVTDMHGNPVNLVTM